MKRLAIASLCAVFCAVLIAGCAVATADKNFKDINAGVAEFQADLTTVISAINSAMPHADTIGQTMLSQALTAAKDANSKAGPISQANDKWKADFSNLQEDDKMVRSSFGWRAEVAIKASIVIAVILAVVVVVLFPAVTPLLMNAGGAIATITAQLHALLPAQNLATLLGSAIKPQAKPTAPANAVAQPVINSGTMPTAAPMVLNSAADAHGI